MPTVNIVRRAKAKLAKLTGNTGLSPLATAVKEDNLTYLSDSKLRRLERFVAQSTNNTPGAVVEFGVALGGSSVLLATQAHKMARMFHGFDVFDMIPPPSPEKDGDDASSRYAAIAAHESKGLGGEVYYGYRSDLYQDVCRALERHDVSLDPAKLRLHQGLFEDTLPQFEENQIAFAHIDCDWYDPVKLCVAETHRRSSKGTVIVIDDYYDFEGCHKAIDEFRAEHPEYTFDDGKNVALIRTR